MDSQQWLPALISVHDVMPETLPHVIAILAGPLSRFEPSHIVLLVVPGRDWQPTDLRQLKQWQAEGYVLAGHGWSHRAARIRGLYHWCHSLLLSRRAAEHLCLSAAGLRALLVRNAQWFVDQGLGQPVLYVPPAWALGALTLDDLRQSPFRAVETLQGIVKLPEGQWRRLPVVGFEADTAWRAWVLSAVNLWSMRWARPDRPVRIAIHPTDFELRLSQALSELLARARSVDWASLW